MPRTTAEKTKLRPSSTGPAAYTGGAPLPSRKAAHKPRRRVSSEDTPEQERSKKQEQQKRADSAKPAYEDNKEQRKGGMLDKARDAVQVAAAMTAAAVTSAQQAVESKLRKKPDETSEPWYHSCFPDAHEPPINEVYQVTYIDGNTQEHVGKMAVATSAIYFADGNKGTDAVTREVVPFKTIASLAVEGDALSGKRLNVYTTDYRVYQFKNFLLPSPDHGSTEVTLREAHDWIDYCWRKASRVPNPAATYHSS